MSLFADQTYENLLASALSRVSSSLDKREGSMVYNGVAPSMAELAQLYIGLDFVFTATYIASAPREYLIERAKDRGLSPKAASAAVFRAEFNVEVPIGSRFSCEDLNFIVTERMQTSDTDNGLSYKAICETAGAAANDYTGMLIPIEYINGLSSANLVELLIPGDDEEETEEFRQRILTAMQSQAFGGNQADYKAKVLDIDGVAAVKVHPVWNEGISPASLIPDDDTTSWVGNALASSDIPFSTQTWLVTVLNAGASKKLTTGGTVRLVIMAADNSAPSKELINTVQTIIDPTQNAGEGMGLAPIGHVVKVDGVGLTTISVTTKLTLNAGYTWDTVKDRVNKAVSNYFGELADDWDSSDNLVVRISQIESRILLECSAYITDISGTKLNGKAANITLGEDYIPVLSSGGVVIG
jgi:uncharacterized phage protein gp47/JayE